MVRKKDGSWRFCVDYRKVNAATRQDAYPLFMIDATLDSLAGSVYFTTLDLASGYWQVELEEMAKETTAFSTLDGHFEFNVLPFGLTNAPATFQRLMECVLEGLTTHECLIYTSTTLSLSAHHSLTTSRDYGVEWQVSLGSRQPHITQSFKTRNPCACPFDEIIVPIM